MVLGEELYKEKVTGERTINEQIDVTMKKSLSDMGGGAEGLTHPGCRSRGILIIE